MGRRHLTPQGRILLWPLMGVGLCYGLLLACTAGLKAFDKDTVGGAFSPVVGWLLFAGPQALALLAVGIVAGAGQQRSFVLGAIVGLLSGLVLVAAMVTGLLGGVVQPLCGVSLMDDSPARQAVQYGLPALLMVCGALGGWIGHRIWKPLPPLPLALVAGAPGAGVIGTSLAVPASAARHTVLPWRGRVGWPRVLVGMGVALVGAVFTRHIIAAMIQAGEGYFRVTTVLQARVTTGEVFALSILLGGCVAGANTGNGLKQGLCAGIGAGLAMMALVLAGTAAQPGPLPFLVLSALVLGPVGGWLGTELLPPAGLAFHPGRKR